MKIILSILIALESVASANTVTVGDPGRPADLPQAIYQAHDEGEKNITITPGVYDLPSMNHKDTLLFNKWSDTTIHAAGVTLIFEELNHRPLHLLRCKHVTWDGGILRFARPSFSQGRIISLGSDGTGDYCDLKIDAGYPTDFKTSGTYDVVDQKTRLLKVDTGDWAPSKAEQTGPGIFRLHYPPQRPGGFAVNDWLLTRAPGGSTIIHVDQSQNCTIENVTLQNAGFAAFFETGGAGGNHYLDCRLQPGPHPPGATEDQLVGCGADGFHSTETEIGPDIENCAFTGVFLDDCIAIHGSFDRVIQAEGRTLTLASAHPMPQSGDPIRVANMHGFFAEALCVNATREQNGTVKITLDQNIPVPIDPSEDIDPRKGTKASDPNYCGRGYKILNCRLGDTRSRGILVKGDDGLISGCTIEGCGMSGVSIGPEFWWNEAGYCRNVTVSSNTFIHCNKNNGAQAAVWIHGDGAIGNQNIVIKDNRFDGCYGPYIIRMEWTNGGDITGNLIVNSFLFKLRMPGEAIRLSNDSHVLLLNNLVAP